MRPEDLGRLTVTPRGALAGPALYMAPEWTASGEPEVRSDLYSLGCTLYRMLAGRPPVVGQAAEDVRRKHAAGAAPGLQAERPDLPEPVARFVARLMAVRPEDRPPSPADALCELRALAGATAAAPARRKLFGVTWSGAWTIIAVLLVAAMVAPFVIMSRMHHDRVQAEQAAAAQEPGAVAILVRPQDPRMPDALSEEGALAVRTLLAYRLSFYPGMSAARGSAEGTPEEVRRTLGVERVLVAAHAAGMGRRNWTLTFADYRGKPWSDSADAAVERNAPDMESLDAAARDLLRAAAAQLGNEVPNPADDGVVSASAPAWAEIGRALQAEAAGRWAEAALHARAAGPAFSALADYCDAVRAAEETGTFPPPGPPPQAPTPPELAGLDGILRTIAAGNADEVTAQFGAVPGAAPPFRAGLLPARPLAPEVGRPAGRGRPGPAPCRRP